jgi:signal transduction histidine kinase
VRTISVVLSHRLGDDGTPVGYLGVADDVTERRRREASIAAALATEKQLVDRLAQVDQTKNDFMATVSHELRTPITSILGYSELLLADDTGTLPAMHHQIVGRIERNGRRLLGLIEDMLTMSQVEVGNVRFHRLPLDLREPVVQALEATQPAFADRGVTVVHDLGEAAVKVEGDADKLERVFTNLLSNAAKFSHEGENVVVRLFVDGDEAVFRVTDTGIGISLEDQANLFDRFFRSADAHARAIQGVGLGLPIAASIVAGHDGVVEVDSALGRGSTFVVRLPLMAEDDPA